MRQYGLVAGRADRGPDSLPAGLACYDPAQHRASAVSYGQDTGVACGILGAVTLWMLGYPDQALRGVEETLALARRLAHPMSLAVALLQSAHLHQLRREPPGGPGAGGGDAGAVYGAGFWHV